MEGTAIRNALIGTAFCACAWVAPLRAEQKPGPKDAPKAPPPPPIVVTVLPGENHARVASLFEGIDLDAATQNVKNVRRTEEAYLTGSCADEIVVNASVTANAEDYTVHFEGIITDYEGAEIQKIALDVSAKVGASALAPIAFKPAANHAGPFYLTGKWSEKKGALKGEFALALGQANSKFVVEDFETIQYPDPNGPLTNTADAMHRGEFGLRITLPKTAAPLQNPTEEEKKIGPLARQSIPFNAELPGHPTKIGVWIKTAAPVRVSMKLHDPGIDARQQRWPDNWTVGPIVVTPGDWQYVTLPMPGYGKPKAQLKGHGDANGIVDYPLTLDHLEIAGAPETVVSMDDVEVWTQTNENQSISVRSESTKPLGLLNRNDAIKLVVGNAWLWKEAQVSFKASLEDISGQNFSFAPGHATLAPGAEHIQPLQLKDLPIGPYKLLSEVKSGNTVTANSKSGAQFLVYEFGTVGQQSGSLSDAELHKLLGNRNALLAELGLTRDIVTVAWHSTDNSPSVEPTPGFWTFGWLDPELKNARSAGVETIGMLGFTPLWADPSATFNRKMSAWYGSTTVMPSREIYWEEYVHRSVAHFGDTISTWIVWDRPDAASFNATPEQYAEQMLDVAHKAAADANSKAKLVSGAITRENIERYLIALSDSGATRYLSGVGILPSTSPLSPEDGFMDVSLARAQRVRRQERIAPELWALNLAWPSGDDQYHVSEFDQALFIPRAYVMCRAQGVNQIILKPDHTEALAKRDSADLIYPEGSMFGIKPAAISAKVVRALFDKTTFVRELFLNDRSDALARAYLFQRDDGKLLLAAWRREGSSSLSLPAVPESVTDSFGNAVKIDSPANSVTLKPAPRYILFGKADATLFAKNLERGAVRYDDAPESAWKQRFTFTLDVGNPDDERTANYSTTHSRLSAPIDSSYHNDYGRHVVDTGRYFKNEGNAEAVESFAVDVTSFGNADLLLRKRIDYAVQNQLVKVYCNGELAGQWFAFKRDRRYRWRDIEFVVPNKFFKGKPSAQLRFVTQGDGESTSFCYWAGPIETRSIYVSDLSLLVGTSGYGPGVNRDKNILGGPIRFFKKTTEPFAKGIGTHSAAALADSLMVLSPNKQYKRFKATVGVDAATNGQGSVRFRIGDGTKMLWDSGDMTYYSEPKDVDIDVSEAIILMLWVDDAGDGTKNDIANWAAARLEFK